MSRRSLIALIVILILIGGIIYWVQRTKKENNKAATPVLSVAARNQTQNADATSVTARPQDTVVFTLTAENQTDKTIPGYVIEANISEVTNVSTLIDAQGASYNAGTSSLVWTPLDIPGEGSVQKQFSVRVNPLTDNSNPVMKIKFNNELHVTIGKPVVAGSNTAAVTSPGSYQAPVTGPAGDLAVWLALAATGLYFGIRKYQTIKA